MNDRLMQPHFLVSTDLDGTLLDHYSYDWQAAAPSLARLAKLGIPVVINTSKTFEEVVSLQSSMLLTAPFIVENGSALFLPTSQFDKRPMAVRVTMVFGDYYSVANGKPLLLPSVKYDRTSIGSLKALAI